MLAAELYLGLRDYEPASSVRGITGDLGEWEENQRRKVSHLYSLISFTDLWLVLSHTRPLVENTGGKYMWIRAMLRCEHTCANCIEYDREGWKRRRENPRVVSWRRKEDTKGGGPRYCQFCTCLTVLYNQGHQPYNEIFGQFAYGRK